MLVKILYKINKFNKYILQYNKKYLYVLTIINYKLYLFVFYRHFYRHSILLAELRLSGEKRSYSASIIMFDFVCNIKLYANFIFKIYMFYS